MKKAKGKSRNTIYLSPSMRFNPGIMAYEPNISKKLNKNKYKIPKIEKIKIIIISVLIVILMILILLYSWYKLD
ncbi:MAG: hypothetical protein AABW56_04445 [Nanoarchaeota archaeon]